jgi:hypothetical protein
MLRPTVSRPVCLRLTTRFLLLSDSWGFLEVGRSLWREDGSVVCQSLLLNSSQSHIATDGQSISKSWCRVPSGSHDQIFITLWQLWSSFSGAPSLTRGRLCLLYMLLALASVVLLGSESFGTRGNILLSQIWNFPFRRLLRLAGLWPRYPFGTDRVENTVSNGLYCYMRILCRGNVFIEPFPNSSSLFLLIRICNLAANVSRSVPIYDSTRYNILTWKKLSL